MLLQIGAHVFFQLCPGVLVHHIIEGAGLARDIIMPDEMRLVQIQLLAEPGAELHLPFTACIQFWVQV